LQNCWAILQVNLSNFTPKSPNDSDKSILKISNRDKTDLRYVLYQVALIALKKNLDFMCYYTVKLCRREKKKGEDADEDGGSDRLGLKCRRFNNLLL